MNPSFTAFRRSLISFLCATGLAATSNAAPLYDSGGFESPLFLSDQSLNGQDPAPPLGNGPWAQDQGTSTALVTAVNAIDGTKSIKITRHAGATGNTRWGVVKSITPIAPDNLVDIRFDMQLPPDLVSDQDYNDYIVSFRQATRQAPEPSLLLLMGTGIAGLASRRLRRAR